MTFIRARPCRVPLSLSRVLTKTPEYFKMQVENCGYNSGTDAGFVREEDGGRLSLNWRKSEEGGGREWVMCMHACESVCMRAGHSSHFSHLPQAAFPPHTSPRLVCLFEGVSVCACMISDGQVRKSSTKSFQSTICATSECSRWLVVFLSRLCSSHVCTRLETACHNEHISRD